MNPETTPSSPAPAPTGACGCCRTTQIVLLVSLIMMGAGNGLFLWNSIRQKTVDVALGSKIVTDFQTTKAPRIKEFISGLQTFARTNPDFNPVLAKYNLLSAAPAKK